MSFVVTTGNKQYLVKNGQLIIVDRIEAEVDSVVELPVVHSVASTKSVSSVKATVVSHQKGDKIRVVKYKAKSRYHKQYGFRPYETVLKIEGTFEQEGKVETKTPTKAPAVKKATKAPTSKATTKPSAKKAAPKKTTDK
jgi:large subunit ribosomal protein L21